MHNISYLRTPAARRRQEVFNNHIMSATVLPVTGNPLSFPLSSSTPTYSISPSPFSVHVAKFIDNQPSRLMDDEKRKEEPTPLQGCCCSRLFHFSSSCTHSNTFQSQLLSFPSLFLCPHCQNPSFINQLTEETTAQRGQHSVVHESHSPNVLRGSGKVRGSRAPLFGLFAPSLDTYRDYDDRIIAIPQWPGVASEGDLSVFLFSFIGHPVEPNKPRISSFLSLSRFPAD